MDAEDPRAIRFKRAVLAGQAEELRRLFAEHSELSKVIDEPWFSFDSPALVHAAGCRDRDLVDALIDLGADVEARSAWTSGPYSALHRLVDGADEESLALAEHIAGRGAEIDIHASRLVGRPRHAVGIVRTEFDFRARQIHRWARQYLPAEAVSALRSVAEEMRAVGQPLDPKAT